MFHGNLQWETSDWGDEVNYYVKLEESCTKIGAAFAAELAEFSTMGLFQISQSAYHGLESYYIEVGLMVAEGEEPFSEAGKRHARRHRIAQAGANAFSIVDGEVSLLPAT